MKLICLALLLLTPVLCTSQTLTPRIELTDADPFSRKQGTSLDVSVFGLYLGQSRAEALAAVKKRGGKLEYSEDPTVMRPRTDECLSRRCDVSIDSHGYFGVGAQFDSADRIEVIWILWDPFLIDDDPKFEQEYAFHVRGVLHDLLVRYSDAYRLKVLGSPTSEERRPANGGESITYLYADRGMTVHVSRSRLAKERDGGDAKVNISFSAPGKAVP